MTIWILAILVLGAAALAGWRQGAIRAAFATVGILFATLLATFAGRIFHPILPHLGASNPITAWALVPVTGFILVSILFAVAAQPVHKRVEHFYKYTAGDLRLALWERLNSRLGICIGLLNGAMYFVLITFLVYGLTYVTTQVSGGASQPAIIRLVNKLGEDLESNHLTRTATAIGTLPAKYYQLADLAGFLVQNPQVGPRLAEYPALTPVWERDDFQALIQDPVLTNALASGTSLGEILKDENVKYFLMNSDQTKLITGIIQTNLDDLMGYLQTGKSAKYDGDKIIGRWEFNPQVTMAWLRQSRPKWPASEMRATRAWMTQAYAQTHVLVCGDSEVFVKSLPRLKTTAGQPPVTEQNNWKGDWSANGKNYDVHLTCNGEDKFLTATAEDLRLTITEGKNKLIFDRAD